MTREVTNKILEAINNYEVSFCDNGDVLLFHCIADDAEHAVEQAADAHPKGNSFDAVLIV